MTSRSLSIGKVGQTLPSLSPHCRRLACLGSLLAACLPALAQDSAGLPDLSLDAAIAAAMRANLGLQVERFEPLIAAEGVTIEEAAFDPTIFANARLAGEEQDVRGSTSSQRFYSAGVEKPLRTGGRITAATSLSRNDGTFYNPDLGQVVGGNLSQNADIGLSITHPLLRGFGIEVTLAELRRAESLERSTRLRLASVVYDLLRDTEIAYWQVADAVARRRLGESNRELARRLVEETRERAEMGLATRIEVLQAEASLAAREQEIIAAEQLLSQRTDALLALIGELREVDVLDPRLDVAQLPEVDDSVPDFPDIWRTAVLRNPEAAIQEEAISRTDLDARLAREQNRPQLDVTLSGAYTGLSDESGRDAYELALERDGHEWGLQLAFNYPFGRRASQAAERQAHYRQEQAQQRLVEIKQDLLRATRGAWRQLSVAQRQVEAARLTVQLQQATFEQERSRFEEGLATLREVLEVQRDLDAARTSLLDARYNAIEAEIQLARQQGILLERHGLEWSVVAPEIFASGDQP